MEVIIFNISLTLQRGLIIGLGIAKNYDLFSLIVDIDRISLIVFNQRIIRIGKCRS